MPSRNSPSKCSWPLKSSSTALPFKRPAFHSPSVRRPLVHTCRPWPSSRPSRNVPSIVKPAVAASVKRARTSAGPWTRPLAHWPRISLTATECSATSQTLQLPSGVANQPRIVPVCPPTDVGSARSSSRGNAFFIDADLSPFPAILAPQRRQRLGQFMVEVALRGSLLLLGLEIDGGVGVGRADAHGVGHPRIGDRPAIGIEQRVFPVAPVPEIGAAFGSRPHERAQPVMRAAAQRLRLRRHHPRPRLGPDRGVAVG